MTITTTKPRSPSWPDPWRCTVEVLVVSGCPGTELAIARVRQATESLGIETNLRVIIVDSDVRAQELGFFGSPTVRVEGMDVEESPTACAIGLSCRLYRSGSDEMMERAPPLAWIEAALARNAPLLGPKLA